MILAARSGRSETGRMTAMVRLRLPAALTVAVLGAVAGVALSCGQNAEYYCAEPGARPDAGPAQPDAAMCGQYVVDLADCPPGCEPEPLG